LPENILTSVSIIQELTGRGGDSGKMRFDLEKCQKEIFAPAHFINLVFKCIHLDELFNIVKDVPNFKVVKNEDATPMFLL